MNADLDALHPYPFEKLAALKAALTPPADLAHIPLTIGEPQHAPFPAALEALVAHQLEMARYPATNGLPALRQTIANWASQRFQLRELDSERHVVPVNGTREAIFAFVQAALDRTRPAKVAVPNPFYQIYEGATLLAGGEPLYLDCTAENNFRPDVNAVPAATWRDVQIVFICSPGNPTGAVISCEQYQRLIQLADRYDFVIASDECYSELYADETNPPPGLLQAASAMGRHGYERCVVFHSLSKRSNLPGLRSGFVAGDADVLQRFLQYRTYHGCAMALPQQYASAEAWSDEDHVLANRDAYRAKFDAVLDTLDGCLEVERPEAGFYLWPKLNITGEAFARRLFAEQNVTVLPGRYLSREADGENPGDYHVRMALVATEAECVEAARRIRECVEGLQ